METKGTVIGLGTEKPGSELEELKKDVQFGFWEKADDSHTVVRFATSWATRMEDVQKLLSLL